MLGSRRVNPRTEANSCEILSNHHQGINGKKTTYLARLQYCDNGARRERKRSASSPAEAKRILKKLESDYVSGGSELLQAHLYDIRGTCRA